MWNSFGHDFLGLKWRPLVNFDGFDNLQNQ